MKRGTTFLGRFESREEAEREIKRLEKESEDKLLGPCVDEEFDSYEIKEVKVRDGDRREGAE